MTSAASAITRAAGRARASIFCGRRVGISGFGSSSLQSTPIIARRAAHLKVFHRTPQFAIPAWNRPLSDEEMREAQA